MSKGLLPIEQYKGEWLWDPNSGLVYGPKTVKIKEWDFYKGTVNGGPAFTDGKALFLGACPDEGAMWFPKNMDKAWHSWQPITQPIKAKWFDLINILIWFDDGAFPIHRKYYDLAKHLYPAGAFRRSKKAASISREELKSDSRVPSAYKCPDLLVEVWDKNKRVGVIMPVKKALVAELPL